MLAFLSIGIGRGHPFYADGSVAALRSQNPDLEVVYADVFGLSEGIALRGWQGVRGAYLAAGRQPAKSGLYGRARAFAAGRAGTLLARGLGAGLRALAREAEVCVVDHPLLLQAIGPHPKLWFQHGEMGVPPEAVPHGDYCALVPTAEAARVFECGGVAGERLTVTGLCVEAALVADAANWAAQRRARYARGEGLCVAAFSSGAEPRHHVEALVGAVESAARAGHRVLAFCARGGLFEAALGAAHSPGVDRVAVAGRDELDRRTAQHFPDFDAILSPAHERSNWALGLGLPLFVVGPDIGPFPPCNRAILVAAGVARPLLDPAAFGAEVSRLRDDGTLFAMSRSGGGRAIDGFRVSAERLLQALGE